MAQALTPAIPVSPNQYFSYNPLLNIDLSKEIKEHKWLRYKSDILAVISLVAFAALVCFGIWYAAFFAAESLQIVVGLLGVGLYVVDKVFFRPYQQEAKIHAEAQLFEERVDKNIKSRLRNSPGDRLIPIRARYDVLREEGNKALQDITDIFHSNPDFTDNSPNNYQAYKMASRLLTHRHYIFENYIGELITRRASKSETVDRYLEIRVHEIFLAYAGLNLNRTGTYEKTGHCTKSRNRDHKDDIFFIFEPSTHGISRRALLDAHKEMASYIVANASIDIDSRPTDIFSREYWDKITTILTKLNLPKDITPKKARMLYRNLELAPYIEQAVNTQFRKDFADYDAHSLRTLLSRYLLTREKLAHGEIFPTGVEFTAEEAATADAVTAEIDATSPSKAEREILFRVNPRIKEIVEAKIAALGIS